MRGKRKLKVHWGNGVGEEKRGESHTGECGRKEECRKGREVIKPNQPNNYKTTPPPKRIEARDGL